MESARKRRMAFMSILSIATIFSGSYLAVTPAYAKEYDLDEISVDFPSRLDVIYHWSPEGYKIFDILDKRTDSLFGTITFVNSDTDPTTFDQGLDYLKQMTNNYQEIKRGCDDGLFAIDDSYCTVAYYAETRFDGGQYVIHVNTQVRDGISAVWSFADYDIDTLHDNMRTIKDIVDSMEPKYLEQDFEDESL